MSNEPSVPEEVLARIVATVAGLADTPEVESFLLGTSREPARESAGLGADAVVDVFRSERASEVDAVIEALRASFAAHRKARQLSVEAPAGEAPPTLTEGSVHHVYVALWAIPDVPPV